MALSQKMWRRIRAAIRDGRTCAECGRVLQPLEAVTRVEFREGLGYECHPCTEKSITFQLGWVRSLGPCEACGRPVSEQTFRSRRSICSDACRIKLDTNRKRERRRAQRRDITCASCGKEFSPSRSDKRTCSNRCRQRVYRLRSRVTDSDCTQVACSQHPLRA